MRVVAGAARGRQLRSPEGRAIRPTSDRAREGIFNSLLSITDLEGATVLDLFAGTGAVGLEALSRGAASVTFVESDRSASEVIRRNIETVGLPGATVARKPAATYLVGSGTDVPFDLVFADPPYAYRDDHLAALLVSLTEPGWLADEAMVVIERSAKGAAPDWPDGIALVTQRRYGEGLLWYGRAHHGG
jgi:16S rRNA (guanine966-N2)-methyltransferase